MKEDTKKTILDVMKYTANATAHQIERLRAQHAQLVKAIEETEQEQCESSENQP